MFVSLGKIDIKDERKGQKRQREGEPGQTTGVWPREKLRV